MKKYLIAIVSAVVLFTACSKDENRVYFEGGTPPVLTASSTTPLVLTMANANNTALSFRWTNPNYQFTTGISSHDVNYVLEVDTTGANFTNPDKQTISIARELGTTLTVKDLNTVLAKMNLLENIPHNVEFRLRSSIGSSVPLYSNVVKMVITPYLDVAVPVPTTNSLWITGDAVASGWSNPLGNPYDVNQKFTRVSNTLYELTLQMPGGGAYKLLQDNGNWATQYHMLPGGTWSGGEFEKRDADPAFPGPPTAGNYKITVNFKTGKYSVVKL